MDSETLKITGLELKPYAVRERVAPVVGGHPLKPYAVRERVAPVVGGHPTF